MLYVIYTILEFMGIDPISMGYFMTVSVMTWIYCYSASLALEFCYVHRLPLYYIMLDEILLYVDYYIGIPVSNYSLLAIHLIIIGLLIFGYTWYYVKCYKRISR